jgi:hypothetical protein
MYKYMVGIEVPTVASTNYFLLPTYLIYLLQVSRIMMYYRQKQGTPT